VSGRVLVVDDEQEMCEAIAAGLGPRGHEVRWETSAEAALATLEGAEVDVEEAERRYILRVVESVGGNKTLAARVLGIGRKTLYRKLAQYGASGE
jgi:two-component system response regulator HydG